MRGLLLFLYLVCFMGSAQAASYYVILVPGTLNSFIQKIYPDSDVYFGREALSAARANSKGVYVAKKLDPLGGFERNGEKLIQEIKSWYAQQPEKLPLVLVGHSAGGFYSFYAARMSGLPIKAIVAISTPFTGSELANLATAFTWNYFLENLCSVASNTFMDCTGLLDLTSKRTEYFLHRYPPLPSQKLYVVGGSQAMPSNISQIRSAEVLSPLLAITGSFLEECSDGLVSCKSAYANVGQLDAYWAQVDIHYLQALHMPLEHGEQVFDDRLFRDLGTKNSDYIRLAQRNFFQFLYQEINRY